MSEMKRVGIRMSQEVYEGYEDLAKRYGIAVSNLMVYVLGQWLDNTRTVQTNLIQNVAKQISDVAKIGLSDEALHCTASTRHASAEQVRG